MVTVSCVLVKLLSVQSLQKGSAEGQRHGHEMVKAQIQRELQSDLFRNVDQSHREMVIMLKVRMTPDHSNS